MHFLHLLLKSGWEQFPSLWPKLKHQKKKGALGSIILIEHFWLVMVMWLVPSGSWSGTEAIAPIKPDYIDLELETLIRLRHSRGVPQRIRSNRAFLIAVLLWNSCNSRISTSKNFKRTGTLVGELDEFRSIWS